VQRLRPRGRLPVRESLNPILVTPTPLRPAPFARPLISGLGAIALALGVVACAAKQPVASNAQLLAPPADPCVLAREDAAANPRLDVERVPSPVKMDPAPIRTPVPRTVLRASKGTSIKAEVMVDTLGKPDMATFAMLETPHAWYTTNLKAAITKWSFEPALRSGCKVPRYYQFIVEVGRRR
jgi:hypothetical protein